MNHNCTKLDEIHGFEIYSLPLEPESWVLAVTIDTCELWKHTSTVRINICPFCGTDFKK